MSGMNFSDDLSAGRGKELPEPGAAATKPKRGMKKGYYVRGVFVAEGSELDLELKSEFASSKSVAKEESTELQKLGEQLLILSAAQIAKLDLPEKLVDAVAEVKRITNFEGRRRQMQYIGKLMRKVEPEPIRAAVDAARNGSAADTLALHRAELWRDDLIANDDALPRWIAEHPAEISTGTGAGTDVNKTSYDLQQLRSLIRQARKDLVAGKPGEAPRQGRAYREIFLLARGVLRGAHDAAAATDEEPSEED
jgi:ribosome-associated protein